MTNSTPETATHYHREDINDQPIVKIMRALPAAAFLGYLAGSAIKYTERNGKKEGTDDEVKCAQYTSWGREFLESDGITLLGQFIPRIKPTAVN